MMYKFITILILLQFLQLVVSRSFSESLIAKNQDRYSKYEQCLRDRDVQIREFGHQLFKAKTVVQDASIKLDCFQCLNLQEQEKIEDMWKPNGGFLGRKIQKKLFELKQSMRRRLQIKEEQQNVNWEFLPLQSNAVWKPVLDLREPSDPLQKFTKSMSELSASSQYKIGNLFELEIREANQSHSGWYRCVQRTKSTAQLSNIYFIDVLNSENVEMREFGKNQSTNKTFKKLSKGLKIYEHTTPWTTCNKCDVTGVKFRYVSCRLKLNPTLTLEDKRFEFLRLFGEVPCQSSLIPFDIRQLIQNYSNAYEFTTCMESCVTKSDQTRVIEGLSNTGEKEIIDELPPNEYSINERLPPLRPQVGRHIINKIEDNPLILDCGIVGNQGVLWHRDFEEFSPTDILTNYTGRIIMSNEGQLIFRKLELRDHGLYSCFVSPYQLVRTFRLYVAESDRTAELVSLMRMCIRFMADFSIIVLVITVLA